MLDENLKAYLIEVNHTPSFTTDTPLDYHIKQSLITDTLVLVNTRSKAKQNYLDSKKQMMFGKTVTKINQEERETQIKKIELYEHKYLNGYCKSLPASDDPLNYTQYIYAAQSIHDEFTGTKRNVEKPQQQPSQTSLSQTQQTQKQKPEVENSPAQKTIRLIKRPASGIPSCQQKKINIESYNNFIQKTTEKTPIFLNQNFQQSPQQQETINGYQPSTTQTQSQVKGNTLSSSSIQTVSVMSQKTNINHIIKNIRKISQISGGYKSQVSGVDFSIDGNDQSSQSMNIYSNEQKHNSFNATFSLINNSREENSVMIFDRSLQLKQIDELGSNNNVQFQRPESGRVYTPTDINMTQIKFGVHPNIRPQSTSLVQQIQRPNNNVIQQGGAIPLPSASTRNYIHQGNKTLVIKLKEDVVNSQTNEVAKSNVIGNNNKGNGSVDHVSQINISNKLRQNRNQFFTIQKVKIEPKIQQNIVPGAILTQNNSYFVPANIITRRVVQSMHGYNTINNQINVKNNCYINNNSLKQSQILTNRSSSSRIQQINNSSLTVLQELGNKNLNVIEEAKEEQIFKARGNSAFGVCRETKLGQFSIKNNINRNRQLSIQQYNNNGKNNNIQPYLLQQQQDECLDLRSNSFGNLHTDKGYFSIGENSTQNSYSNSDKKNQAIRKFKFDHNLSNLLQFNLEDDICS